MSDFIKEMVEVQQLFGNYILSKPFDQQERVIAERMTNAMSQLISYYNGNNIVKLLGNDVLVTDVCVLHDALVSAVNADEHAKVMAITHEGTFYECFSLSGDYMRTLVKCVEIVKNQIQS
jgi:hypothetical protein